MVKVAMQGSFALGFGYRKDFGLLVEFGGIRLDEKKQVRTRHSGGVVPNRCARRVF